MNVDELFRASQLLPCNQIKENLKLSFLFMRTISQQFRFRSILRLAVSFHDCFILNVNLPL